MQGGPFGVTCKSFFTSKNFFLIFDEVEVRLSFIMVEYIGKLVLAPMVRAGELPTRLLALKYGADLVWSPEIIDKKILTCERIENEKLGTIDFLSTGQTKIPGVTNLVFRTHPELERNKLIFQMGTSNSEIAVQAAKLIINDVDGIDINAGCPKHFSIHSGMGAALLKTPEILIDILEKLVEEIGKPNNKPISVKIRLLPDEDETLELIKRLVKTGISNLTVHCRTQNMRNREDPIRYYFHKIKKICDENKVSLIINGQVTNRKDFEELKSKWIESQEFDEIVPMIKDDKNVEEFLKMKISKVNEIGGMIATEAEINPTCFNLKPLHWVELIKEYTDIAELNDNFTGNSKYMLTRMIPGKNPYYQILSRLKTYNEFKESFKLLNEDGKLIKNNEINEKKHKLNQSETAVKKQQTEAIKSSGN